MRYVFLSFLLVFSLFASTIEKTIDELVKEETPSSLNLPQYDPFKRAKPLIKRKSSSKTYTLKAKPLVLLAIMNNRAFISGFWYAKGESLRGYKVKTITQKSVQLKKGSKTKVLYIQKRDDYITSNLRDKK